MYIGHWCMTLEKIKDIHIHLVIIEILDSVNIIE